MKRVRIIPFVLLLPACIDPTVEPELSDEESWRADPAELELACSVSVIPKQTPDSPSQLRVSVVNLGDSPAQFVARNLPFASPEREYFTVDRGDQPVDFWGLRVKLEAPTEADLVELDAGDALATVYTLSDYYHLDQPGTYDIALLRPSVHVFGAEGIRKVELACNAVELELAKAEPPPEPLIEPDSPGQKSAEGASFKDCDAHQQAEILRAEAVAKWMLPIALGTHTFGRSQVAADSKYYDEWFGAHTTDRAQKVDEKLDKIVEGLDEGIEYKCHSKTERKCEKGTIAWVIPVLSDKVHLCERFFEKDDVGWDTKWGILVHEFSHLFALTHDYEYGRPDSLALADNQPNKAVKNADNYEYFVEDIYLGLAPRHDVDGDGHSDLVTTAWGSGFVYPGKSTSTFGSYVASFAGTMNTALFDGAGHWLLDVVDMNLDGHDDLVTIGSDGVMYVYFGTASGTVYTGVVEAGLDGGDNLDLVFDDGVGYEPIGVADTNGNLAPDLVTIRDDGAVCWFGGLNGGLSGSKVCTAGLIDSAFMDGVGEHVIDLADVNGDRRADLIAAADDGTVYVYTGTAGGSFGAGVGSFAGTYNLALYDGFGHEPIGVAEVTGDGRADLVTHHHVSNNTYVYPGQANATFGSGVPSFAGTMNSSLFDQTGHELIGVFDVDGNGLADLVTHAGGNAFVYRGTQNGQFTSGGVSFSGTLNSSRFDGDGHEFITERRQHRRRGCTPTGCL
ncbi:MAG TPA: M35 family metallo-endopeptidase [Enhygromyxa sp.]|nr:M35 family metallo-endopeptidase [Enhygromyxa sp.]